MTKREAQRHAKGIVDRIMAHALYEVSKLKALPTRDLVKVREACIVEAGKRLAQ